MSSSYNLIITITYTLISNVHSTITSAPTYNSTKPIATSATSISFKSNLIPSQLHEDEHLIIIIILTSLVFLLLCIICILLWQLKRCSAYLLDQKDNTSMAISEPVPSKSSINTSMAIQLQVNDFSYNTDKIDIANIPKPVVPGANHNVNHHHDAILRAPVALPEPGTGVGHHYHPSSSLITEDLFMSMRRFHPHTRDITNNTLPLPSLPHSPADTLSPYHTEGGVGGVGGPRHHRHRNRRRRHQTNPQYAAYKKPVILQPHSSYDTDHDMLTPQTPQTPGHGGHGSGYTYTTDVSHSDIYGVEPQRQDTLLSARAAAKPVMAAVIEEDEEYSTDDEEDHGNEEEERMVFVSQTISLDDVGNIPTDDSNDSDIYQMFNRIT